MGQKEKRGCRCGKKEQFFISHECKRRVLTARLCRSRLASIIVHDYVSTSLHVSIWPYGWISNLPWHCLKVLTWLPAISILSDAHGSWWALNVVSFRDAWEVVLVNSLQPLNQVGIQQTNQPLAIGRSGSLKRVFFLLKCFNCVNFLLKRKKQ